MILKNPNYLKMLKLGKSLRWTPKKIEIPVLGTPDQLPASNPTTINLYPDQQEVFDQLKDLSNSLLEARTGAGKTVISIALHQAWGGRTLIVCHSLVLAKQFADEFIKFTNTKPTFVCDGKHDQTGKVVVTTLTTFRKKYKEFLNFNNLIIDEADLAMTNKTMKAIASFKSTRKHGFTGTTDTVYDESNPNLAPVLGLFWGNHVTHTPAKTEIPLKKVISYTYDKTYPKVFPHKNWIEFRTALDDDVDRKRQQLQWLLDNTNPQHHTLALWDRVADVETFYRALKKRNLPVYKSTGSMKKKEREQHLTDFKRTGGYLVGVSSTLNRGYDNTLLTKAFIMHPIKGENPLRQSIGRLMRYFDGKRSTLYLWSDSMLSFQLKKQEKIIEKYFNLPICESQTLELNFKDGGK